jgi:POT family proton-dependent oligopeptide transporter
VPVHGRAHAARRRQDQPVLAGDVPLLNSIGFAHILPVSLALFSKISPRQINATVIGLYYLSFFLANYTVGQIGPALFIPPTTTFWLIHVASAAFGSLRS